MNLDTGQKTLHWVFTAGLAALLVASAPLHGGQDVRTAQAPGSGPAINPLFQHNVQIANQANLKNLLDVRSDAFGVLKVAPCNSCPTPQLTVVKRKQAPGTGGARPQKLVFQDNLSDVPFFQANRGDMAALAMMPLVDPTVGPVCWTIAITIGISASLCHDTDFTEANDCSSSSGCTSAAPCTTNDECSEGSQCTNGGDCSLAKDCTQGGDCTQGDQCSHGPNCTKGEQCSTGDDCTSYGECSTGTECTNGPHCSNQDDCTEGDHCSTGENCTAGGVCSSHTECTSDPSCSNGTNCTTGATCSSTTGCTTGPECSQGDKCSTGPACTSGSDGCQKKLSMGLELPLLRRLGESLELPSESSRRFGNGLLVGLLGAVTSAGAYGLRRRR